MTDRHIDDVLRRAAMETPDVDSALAHRITTSIAVSLRPVRPLPPAWVLITGLCIVCGAVALGGASVLGFNGIRRLTGAQIAFMFPMCGILVWLAARASAGEIVPGRAPRVSAAWIPAIAMVALLATFAALFHEYRVDRFVPQGIVCLTAGFVHAIAAAIGAFLLLRRGYAVNALSAGLVTGTLAGLAGVIMLELHCANLQAPHILVWHTAVLPLAVALVALVARLIIGSHFRRPRA